MTANNADIFGSLLQSFLQEHKASGNSWENVSSKAAKLSVQLNALASALAAFIDAIQTISDSANNIKGVSRDIGACLTRFCMRQKSLEGIIKNLATALNDQLVGSLEKKSVEWKQRVGEIERRYGRNIKKLRQSRKGPAVDADCRAESRNSYSQFLFEQRNQFVAFVNALLPVINTEVALLDEGPKVREVRDSIEKTINESDSQLIVQALLEDLASNNNAEEKTWTNRINARVVKPRSADAPDGGANFAARQQMAVWPPPAQSQQNSLAYRKALNKLAGMPANRPHTISTVQEPYGGVRRIQISTQTFTQPNPNRIQQVGGEQQVSPTKSMGSSTNSNFSSPTNSLKPPLPVRRQQFATINNSSYPPPRLVHPSNNVAMTMASHHPGGGSPQPGGHLLSASANDLHHNNNNNPNDSGALHYRAGSEVAGWNSRPISLTGGCLKLDEHFGQVNLDLGDLGAGGGSGPAGGQLPKEDRCSSSLIAETLYQIDQLGVELDSYCRTLKPMVVVENGSSGVGSSNASLDRVNPQHQHNGHHQPPQFCSDYSGPSSVASTPVDSPVRIQNQAVFGSQNQAAFGGGQNQAVFVSQAYCGHNQATRGIRSPPFHHSSTMTLSDGNTGGMSQPMAIATGHNGGGQLAMMPVMQQQPQQHSPVKKGPSPHPGLSSSVPSSSTTASMGVRYRPPQITNNFGGNAAARVAPPLPPERRNSEITSANPAAPSVAEFRNVGPPPPSRMLAFYQRHQPQPAGTSSGGNISRMPALGKSSSAGSCSPAPPQFHHLNSHPHHHNHHQTSSRAVPNPPTNAIANGAIPTGIPVGLRFGATQHFQNYQQQHPAASMGRPSQK